MRIAYICDYCDRQFKEEGRCLQHEMNCLFDPRNRSCGTCNHLHIHEHPIFEDEDWHFCNMKNKDFNAEKWPTGCKVWKYNAKNTQNHNRA